MDLQRLTATVGAAVTTFLVFGAATIELMVATVGGEIGPGIVGVFVGAVAAIAAVLLVGWRWTSLAERGRTAVLAYSAFGLTVLFLAFLSYVNTPGVDTYLGIRINLVIAAVVALVVVLGRRTLGDSAPPA